MFKLQHHLLLLENVVAGSRPYRALKARVGMQWNEKRLEADRTEENEGAEESGKEVTETSHFTENRRVPGALIALHNLS